MSRTKLFLNKKNPPNPIKTASLGVDRYHKQLMVISQTSGGDTDMSEDANPETPKKPDAVALPS